MNRFKTVNQKFIIQSILLFLAISIVSFVGVFVAGHTGYNSANQSIYPRSSRGPSRLEQMLCAWECADPEPEETFEVIREKRFAVKPCTTDEAILQMNLLGHSFFMYRSMENDQIQVVYRRADGGYGVLIPLN